MKSIVSLVLVVLGFAVIAAGVQVSAASSNTSASPTYDITTLAGKVASIQGTQGFYLRASALIERTRTRMLRPRTNRRLQSIPATRIGSSSA